ncbi:MAG: M48 family metallopeptidase [Thermodesulfobacteriota bacterium]
MQFDGTLFDGKTARAIPVSVHVQGWIIRVADADGTVHHDVTIDQCRMVPPLGSTRRSLFLPDGTRIDTDDHAAMATLDQKAGTHRGTGIVNAIESKWPLALAATAALVVCVWLFIQYGIPAAAERAARSVPPPILETISAKAIDQLDKGFFEPTALDADKRAAAEEVFAEVAATMGRECDCRLLFRHSAALGANALALPSGQIVVTDALVRLADSESELAGVLAHEMAHVKKRHGIRMIFQQSGVFFIVSMLVGDVVSITSTAAALPTVLVNSGYSREFERQADDAAGRYLIKQGMGTGPYRAMLRRLLEQGQDGGPSMLSTHPATEDRIEQLKEMEQRLTNSHSFYRESATLPSLAQNWAKNWAGPRKTR